MPANTTGPIFELEPKVWSITLTNADTTVQKTMGAVGANGARIDSIRCCTDDTSAVNLKFFLSNGETDFYLGVVSVPSNSGYTTIPIVEAVNTLSYSNLLYLIVPAGWTLKVGCVATMTAAKTTTVTAIGGNY